MCRTPAGRLRLIAGLAPPAQIATDRDGSRKRHAQIGEFVAEQ
jgi:hypothetical protein